MLCRWVVVSLWIRTSASHFHDPALPIIATGWGHLGRCPLNANRPNGCVWSSGSRPTDEGSETDSVKWPSSPVIHGTQRPFFRLAPTSWCAVDHNLRAPEPKMTNSTSSTSLESSVTATEADVQSQSPGTTSVSHFKIVFDRAGVTKEALQWRYPGHGTEDSPYAVDFTPCDPYNPQQWTQTKKWCMTILTAVSTLAVAFVSSAFSGGLAYIIAEFKVSQELSILGLSLFVVGFAVGPLLWAPASEFYGRQILFTITYAALTAFNAGAAGVKSFSGLVVLRFFAGAFGSSPLTNSGGVIADMFSQKERGFATACFAAAPFLGPSLGKSVQN